MILTPAELAIVGSYRRDLAEFQNLFVAKQQALAHIIGLALDSRGLDPRKYQVDGEGHIVKALKK